MFDRRPTFLSLCATAAMALMLPGVPALALQQEGMAELILVSAPASYLGLNIRDLDDHAAHLLNLKSTMGVEVTAVDHDAPAGKAGIHLRDVIVAVDGKPVTSALQFRETMRGFAPQKVVALSILREGKPLKFTVKLADRAKLQQQAFEDHFIPVVPSLGRPFNNAAAFFNDDGGGSMEDRRSANGENENVTRYNLGSGAELDSIGPQLAQYFGVKDGTGMLVKSVEPGTPAAAAGLLAGDVVLKVNDEQIVSPIDWMRAVENGQGRPMQLTIVRNKRMQTITMPAGPRTQAMLEMPRVDEANPVPAFSQFAY